MTQRNSTPRGALMQKISSSSICRRCGTDKHVHRGLCHRCREMNLFRGPTVSFEEGVASPHEFPAGSKRTIPLHRRGA